MGRKISIFFNLYKKVYIIVYKKVQKEFTEVEE